MRSAARSCRHAVFGEANGFSHPKVGPDKLDFSGLSYDPRSDSLWIVSDQGRCLFQYDWTQDVVLQRPGPGD